MRNLAITRAPAEAYGNSEHNGVYFSYPHNSGPGIDVLDGSSAAVHATHIAGNTGVGIVLYFTSTLSLQSGSVIENNDGGIGAMGGSSMVLGDDVKIQSNRGDGINLADVSVAAAFGNPLIQNNGGWGVSCGAFPAVAQLTTSVFGTVTGNTAGQVSCPGWPPR